MDRVDARYKLFKEKFRRYFKIIRREIIDLVDDLAFTANVFTTEEKVITILTNRLGQNINWTL